MAPAAPAAPAPARRRNRRGEGAVRQLVRRTAGEPGPAPGGNRHQGPPVDLPTFQALAESISRCQQAGLARAGDDPQWLAAQVWAALHGLVLLRLNAPGFPWPGPLEQMADQAVARLIRLETVADEHQA